MIALWILGILILLLIWLCLTRVGAQVTLSGGSAVVDVKFGLFRFRVFPGKKKSKPSKEETAEKLEKPKEKKEKQPMPKPTFADIKDAVRTLWPPLKRALDRTCRGIRIHPLTVSLILGGSDDPAAAAELYGYATDADTVTNFRLEKINYCKLLLEDSRSLTHLFGAELEQLAFGGGNYDPENDFHGIYVLCGAVGLGLMVLFLLYFVWRIVRALLRSFTEVFTWEAAGFGVALITCVVHAYYTAGVLRRPNVTFYLGTILAAIYILTRKAQKREETL